MPKIYTKVGDSGKTSLVGGQKVGKNDPRLDTYGTIDELNSFIGLAVVELENHTTLKPLAADLQQIQNWLFDLGSLLASLPEDQKKFSLAQIKLSSVQFLESKIDLMTTELEPLKNFILPGGCESAARLHLCRTISRRAERLLVSSGIELPENSLPFMNRLSDYFFVCARYTNLKSGKKDILWTQGS